MSVCCCPYLQAGALLEQNTMVDTVTQHEGGC